MKMVLELLLILLVIAIGTAVFWVPLILSRMRPKCPYCGAYLKHREITATRFSEDSLFWNKHCIDYFDCGTSMIGNKLEKPGNRCEAANEIWKAAKKKYEAER